MSDLKSPSRLERNNSGSGVAEMVWLGVAKTDPPRKNRSPDQILPVRSTCRTADEPHSILISSDSAPSGTDAVFGTLTALAGKCTQKYQTAMTKATTINGSPRKAANLSQEGSPGRTMVDGTTMGWAGAIANSRFGAAGGATSNATSSSSMGSGPASGASPLLTAGPFSRNCGTYCPDGITMRKWRSAPS